MEILKEIGEKKAEEGKLTREIVIASVRFTTTTGDDGRMVDKEIGGGEREV